jgi:hypothetical protein
MEFIEEPLVAGGIVRGRTVGGIGKILCRSGICLVRNHAWRPGIEIWKDG